MTEVQTVLAAKRAIHVRNNRQIIAQVSQWQDARLSSMAANALVVAHFDLVVGVTLSALWLRALPALELLRVATSAGEAGRGNAVGADVRAASGASGRWWRERGGDLDSARSLESLLENLWLWGWSGGVDLLDVSVGLLIGVVLRLRLLLLLLGGNLGGSWEENAWLEIARSGDWTTEFF